MALKGIFCCLSFHLKNRSVESCCKWNASKPRIEIFMGLRAPFPRTFSRRRKQPERAIASSKEQMERTFSVWKFRLGILDCLSRNPVFSENFPFWKTKLVFSFTFQPKFRITWVNGTQTLFHLQEPHKIRSAITACLLVYGNNLMLAP